MTRSPGTGAQLFFSVDVCEGPYAPATLTFWIKVFDEYPLPSGYSIRCTKRIFHPNIDPETGRMDIEKHELEGKDPSKLRSILSAIRQRILEPVDVPAVNPEAAMLRQTDPEEFRRTVRKTLGGGEHRGVQFDRISNL